MEEILSNKPDLSKDIEYLQKMKELERSKNMHSVRLGSKTIISFSSEKALQESLSKLGKLYKMDCDD